MCPFLRLHLLATRWPWGRVCWEWWHLGVLGVGRPGMGPGAGVQGRAAAVFSHSFPRSSYLLSVWLW